MSAIRRGPSGESPLAVGPPVAWPPSSLSPALVGAVVTGRMPPELFDATLLALGSRGALRLVPDGPLSICVRLGDPSGLEDDFERHLWRQCERRSGADALVPGDSISLIRSQWQTRLAPVLLGELCERGLALGRQRVPDGGRSISTTRVGETLAGTWRGYRAWLETSGRRHEVIAVEGALPYALAMGCVAAITHQLQRADGSGVTPSWLEGGASARWSCGYGALLIRIERGWAGGGRERGGRDGDGA